jgi:hypothetical protein
MVTNPHDQVTRMSLMKQLDVIRTKQVHTKAFIFVPRIHLLVIATRADRLCINRWARSNNKKKLTLLESFSCASPRIACASLRDSKPHSVKKINNVLLITFIRRNFLLYFETFKIS